MGHLHGGLQRAENLVRAGELGQAIWAYLEVLEVDPDNPTALCKQVSQIVTAVRQFDAVTPGRRWADGLDPNLPRPKRPWWEWLVLGSAVCVAFGLGILAANIELPELPTIDFPVLHKDQQMLKPRRIPESRSFHRVLPQKILQRNEELLWQRVVVPVPLDRQEPLRLVGGLVEPFAVSERDQSVTRAVAQ